MLTYQFDDYNGIVLNKQKLPESMEDFSEQFHELLQIASAQTKQLIWFSLAIEQSAFIKPLTDAGFVFHNCLEDEITLILRFKPDAYAPFVPTYSIGAGALIFNEQNQVLVIRENLGNHSGFKLPGGHIELGEKISEAIVREVFEETGIHSEFVAIQGFASKEVFRFGKSNIYFLCALNALTTEIDIQDIDEIAEAKWCDVNTFIEDKNNSYFTREIIRNLQHKHGFELIELAENSGPHIKHEVFFESGISN